MVIGRAAYDILSGCPNCNYVIFFIVRYKAEEVEERGGGPHGDVFRCAQLASTKETPPCQR